jgi:hypothetical protein
MFIKIAELSLFHKRHYFSQPLTTKAVSIVVVLWCILTMKQPFERKQCCHYSKDNENLLAVND